MRYQILMYTNYQIKVISRRLQKNKRSVIKLVCGQEKNVLYLHNLTLHFFYNYYYSLLVLFIFFATMTWRKAVSGLWGCEGILKSCGQYLLKSAKPDRCPNK